jgi:uncharacterized protein
VLIGAAMARAADRAYASVRDPAEGTILTVVREMAHRVATELAHMPETRLGTEGDDARQDALIADVLERALDAGQASVRRGPDLLPVLREAGVVDAGGFGLTVIFAGVIAVLRGAAPPELDHHAPARVTHPEHVSQTYRYCTNFAVTGTGLEPSAYVPELEAIGDSVLVVGDRSTLKVHVHTDAPEAAMAVFGAAGEVSRLDVADMTVQVAARADRLEAAQEELATCGALAVVAGDGMAALFRSLGVVPLDGGPTMNPSTYELLAGIHGVPAETVVVLPNSGNVIMAAERAAELSDKGVRVIGARSPQAGLVAAVGLEPQAGLEANAEAMEAALMTVRTGAVTAAARDDADARFAAGDAIGFVDDALVAWGEPEATLREVLATLGDGAELLTVIEGDGAPLGQGEVAGLVPDGVELDQEHGGQPSYWWLIAAE